ncbi:MULTISPECIES: hypothetical protein [Bacillus cereus group]|uniref:Uncharacterized protein n=1 Tax=Bacillus thuringiensis serovar mexicanensis TaxID=180868 RepID=A0A242WA79_BACTU|nr:MULTISPECIES: hypothetical protein [Bacillus cereus group]EEM56249.1 hypothetical protein bthur0007_58690 [Bacillus thuringiensis serovar monterrey BGSC 4AJ1]MEB9673941.1 hypothetical protein [Bacillus anthracis]OTW50876.1 hypothetical protein BK699_10045 [Bacillus thuringiensis serovar mexicanensis]OTX09561.1 hypothetical protein BK705_05090 [Bacillus thuringiensis serovar monterrey]PFJ30561.1 hypothetical protein COI92_06105 [Bacillus anthracis]
MKKKRLVMSVLSLALAASVVFPSFASADYHEYSSVKITGEKSTTSAFNVSPGYGYLKLWFKNNGESTVTITVKNVNTGKKYFTYDLPKGKSYTWRSVLEWPGGAVGAGNYSITYRDGNKGKVNVEFSGFSSNDEDEGRRG